MPPSAERSTPLASTGTPSFAASRPATSRPSYVIPKRIRSGWCSPTSAASASAAGPPRSTSPYAGSVAANRVVAPCAPSSPAAASASLEKATASVVPPSDRAFARSSSATGAGLPSVMSAKTHTFPTATVRSPSSRRGTRRFAWRPRPRLSRSHLPRAPEPARPR